MTATSNDHDGHNHDDQLGEIYPTMLNELNCTFGVSFSRFNVAIMVMVCGRRGLWSSWFVAIVVCGHHGCGRHGIGRI